MKKVTMNREQRLYIIPCTGGGYSCLGFDVCKQRAERLRNEFKTLGFVFPAKARTGTLAAYNELAMLQYMAQGHNERTGYRFKCELTPQLIGLEGKRVEVTSDNGETRRFQVGKSTGFIPIHLEIARRNCHGGGAVWQNFKTVRIIK